LSILKWSKAYFFRAKIFKSATAQYGWFIWSEVKSYCLWKQKWYFWSQKWSMSYIV